MAQVICHYKSGGWDKTGNVLKIGSGRHVCLRPAVHFVLVSSSLSLNFSEICIFFQQFAQVTFSTCAFMLFSYNMF